MLYSDPHTAYSSHKISLTLVLLPWTLPAKKNRKDFYLNMLQIIFTPIGHLPTANIDETLSRNCDGTTMAGNKCLG